MLASPEEQTLMKRCLAGDSEGWTALFTLFYPRAKAVAMNYPFRFEAHTAEDIAQETVIELTRQFCAIRNPKGFVGRVAHNKCVDYLRKKREIPLPPSPDDSHDPADLDPAAIESLPPGVEDNEALGLLDQALHALGEPCRGLLHARFMEDLSYAEAAEKTAIPVAQVGVYISRCLDRLRKHISNEPMIWKELKALL